MNTETPKYNILVIDDDALVFDDAVLMGYGELHVKMRFKDLIQYNLKLASVSFAGDTRHQAGNRIAYCKRLITQ